MGLNVHWMGTRPYVPGAGSGNEKRGIYGLAPDVQAFRESGLSLEQWMALRRSGPVPRAGFTRTVGGDIVDTPQNKTLASKLLGR
jgi:hypothetical protein